MTAERTPLEARLAAMTADVRSYDAVVVVGAGLSAFAYPMTGQLPALVWQAVSEVDGAAAELERRLGRHGTPKELLGTDPATVAAGWQLARDFPNVRAAFQQGFVALDAEREPSGGHLALARLIRAGRVRMVVSYNWDSCLERAYRQEFGTPLPAGILFKPHGDVMAPGEPWTLPDEDGLVPNAVLARIVELGAHPRTLLILGYSGSDAHVAQTLLEPLQVKWPVHQISPSAHGEDGVPTTADHAAATLVENLLSPTSTAGWRYVIFDRGRDFTAALRGERLRPSDVDACPELPHAQALADRLAAGRYATLSGGSGTGKSITAFHAARRLNQDGWTVVELARTGVATADDVRAFTALSGPVLAVVDDAQAVDPGVVANFGAAVDDSHAVLLVSTERLEGHNDETVSEIRAKEQIYEYCVVHVAEVGPRLTALDDRVGNGMMSEPPLQRLRAANASSRDPWSFMFVASGGERRMENIIGRLIEGPPNALLLAAIAAGQIASQDAGVSRNDILHDIALAAPDAFGPPGNISDEAAFTEALATVQSERIVRENRGQLRTAHIRVAQNALLELARHADDNIGTPVRALIRNHLRRPDLTTRGKYWLINTLEYSQSMRYNWRSEWLDPQTVDELVGQALVAQPGPDRSVAAGMLGSLSWVGVLEREHWERIVHTLTEWLPNLTADEVFGVRRLLMYMRNDNKDLHHELAASLSAATVAEMLSHRGTRPSAHGWSELLREIAPPHDIPERAEWSAAFTQAVDTDALQAWLADIDSESHPGEIYDLVDTLAELAPKIATLALQACAPHLKTSLERDLADATNGFADWTFGYMHAIARLAPAVGVVDDDEDEEGQKAYEAWVPTPELSDFIRVVLLTMQSIDWTRAGSSLAGRARYQVDSLDQFLWWLGTLSSDLLDSLSAAISFDWLTDLANTAHDEDLAVGSVAEGPTTLEPISLLLYCLAAGPAGNALVRTYLEDQVGKVSVFPFELIEPFADVAVAFHQAGATVVLENPRGGPWRDNVNALNALRKVDRSVAKQVLSESASKLNEAFRLPQSHDMRDLPTFLEVADDIDAAEIDKQLAALNADDCAPVWAARLKDAGDDARALVVRASKVASPLGAMARTLLGSGANGT